MRSPALLLVLTLGACTHPPVMEEKPPDLPASPGTEVSTPSGLHYVELARGTGRYPRKGDTVVVHYTGRLEDGTLFDSSRRRGEPYSFRLGAKSVIQGWSEGISLMRVGGRRKLIIPPGLGYGNEGAGNIIPPDAVLTFDVELLDLK